MVKICAWKWFEEISFGSQTWSHGCFGHHLKLLQQPQMILGPLRSSICEHFGPRNQRLPVKTILWGTLMKLFSDTVISALWATFFADHPKFGILWKKYVRVNEPFKIKMSVVYNSRWLSDVTNDCWCQDRVTYSMFINSLWEKPYNIILSLLLLQIATQKFYGTWIGN